MRATLNTLTSLKNYTYNKVFTPCLSNTCATLQTQPLQADVFFTSRSRERKEKQSLCMPSWAFSISDIPCAYCGKTLLSKDRVGSIVSELLDERKILRGRDLASNLNFLGDNMPKKENKILLKRMALISNWENKLNYPQVVQLVYAHTDSIQPKFAKYKIAEKPLSPKVQSFVEETLLPPKLLKEVPHVKSEESVKKFTSKVLKPMVLSKEHIVLRSAERGRYVPNNILFTHEHCNSLRGNTPFSLHVQNPVVQRSLGKYFVALREKLEAMGVQNIDRYFENLKKTISEKSKPKKQYF